MAICLTEDHATCCALDELPMQSSNKLEMWANAQRDGRPAEYRWRPLLMPQFGSLADAHY